MLLALAFRAAAADDLPYRFERAFPALSFEHPVFVTAAPGEPRRLYVVTQAGTIERFDLPGAKAETFLDLHDRVRQSGGEEGLLGLAFHPDYAKNGLFYVYYSASEPHRQVLSRFHASAGKGEPASEKKLLEVPDEYSNHNGGMLAFGPDRMLYVASGDGGSAGDPGNNAQDLSSLLGKIWRLTPEGTVPADNPFVVQKAGQKDARGEIWAYGLRNPWRFSFDRETGALWAADVGQNQWEEIDLIVKGGNYGWRLWEGNHEYKNPRHRQVDNGLIAPVAVYGHDEGCSITGGYVYRGKALPALRGQYLYGDFCSGKVWALATEGAAPRTGRLIANVPSPASFGEDSAGELYVASYDGKLYRLVAP